MQGFRIFQVAKGLEACQNMSPGGYPSKYRFFIICTVYSPEKRNLHTPFVPGKSLYQNSSVGQLFWEDGRRLGP